MTGGLLAPARPTRFTEPRGKEHIVPASRFGGNLASPSVLQAPQFYPITCFFSSLLGVFAPPLDCFGSWFLPRRRSSHLGFFLGSCREEILQAPQFYPNTFFFSSHLGVFAPRLDCFASWFLPRRRFFAPRFRVVRTSVYFYGCVSRVEYTHSSSCGVHFATLVSHGT